MAYRIYRESTRNATFLKAKDTMSNASPITLYTVEVPSTATLYYCEYTDGQSVSYFLPASSTAQTYTPAPITYEAIQSNIQGEVDNLVLTLSNVDKTIQSYLHNYDALRGAKVNIITVFKGGLTDWQANQTDTFYIDGVELSTQAARFSLTSKFNVQRVTLPMRHFRRDQCQWTFKSDDCGYAGAIAGCSKTLASCADCDNLARFGGFPSIPHPRVVR